MPIPIIPAGDSLLRVAALVFLFQRLPPTERETQLAKTLAAVSRRELSLENLLVAIDGVQIVGAVMAVRRPGGIAVLGPPVVQPGPRAQEIARGLLEAVGQRVDRQQVQYMQCLIDPADEWTKGALALGGILYATDLLLMSRSLPGDRCDADASGLTAQSYTIASRGRFARIIEGTYPGSLDCPALVRIRSGGQVLDAHRATGQFNPQAWRIYQTDGRDVGVLLMAEHPDREVWEVVYLGVVPESRRRGFGRAILNGGIRAAQATRRTKMELAVDVANSPARRLYETLGFSEMRRLGVHLRIVRQATSISNESVPSALAHGPAEQIDHACCQFDR